jgi:DNA-directed RNA polymerase
VDNQYEIITDNRKSYVILNPEEPNLEIPSIPKLGDLDIENIIKSKYMIS